MLLGGGQLGELEVAVEHLQLRDLLAYAAKLDQLVLYVLGRHPPPAVYLLVWQLIQVHLLRFVELFLLFRGQFFSQERSRLGLVSPDGAA